MLVLDATELVTDQDAHIAGAIVEAKKACVVVVNKWDLVDLGPTAGDEYRRLLAERLKHLSWAPVLLASALNGRNIAKLLDLARDGLPGVLPHDTDAGAQLVLPPGRGGVQAADAQGAQDLDGLHHPGVDAPADVRGARERRRPGALHLPALPREPDARAVRLRRHVDRPALSQQDAPRRGETRGGESRHPQAPRPEVQRRQARQEVRREETRREETARKPARKSGARQSRDRKPESAGRGAGNGSRPATSDSTQQREGRARPWQRRSLRSSS